MVDTSRDPQRIRRRDALRLLAASTGAVAGGSLIVSGPAHADVGSEACLFAFTGNPIVTISAFNTSFIGDFVTLSIGSVPGSCPCGAAASIQYAFHLVTPLSIASSGAWSATNSASLSFANLWPAAGGPFTVSAGVRITCTGPSGTTIRCRFASGTFNMPASFGSVGTTFPLPTNNGNSAFPNLPACDAAALRVAALTSDGLMMAPGLAPVPRELQALIDGVPEQQPIDVFAEPSPPDAGKPSADDAAPETTSTTTTSPEQTPETSPSTTSTTTTTSPDSTPSTTIPNPTTTSTTPAD